MLMSSKEKWIEKYRYNRYNKRREIRKKIKNINKVFDI